MPFEDPYRERAGGDTHPLPRDPPFDAQYPRRSARTGVIDPDINSTRVQSWNVTVERQIGTAWQASVSYLGSYLDRLWGGCRSTPANFMGLGPCTLRASLPVVHRRRESRSASRAVPARIPVSGQGLGPVNRYAAVGTQIYRGAEAVGPASRGQRPEPQRQLHAVALRGRHRSERQLRLQFDGRLPRSRTIPSSIAATARRTGRHIGNVSVGAQTPASRTRRCASWRLTGASRASVSARSGGWLTVTTGRDIAGTGIAASASIRCTTMCTATR